MMRRGNRVCFGRHAGTFERGMTRIGFLGWPSGSDTGGEREAGWREAMTAAGLADGLESLRETAVDRVTAAREASARLLDRVPDLDAVVAASDGLALGAVVQTNGATPVIGFDNTPVSEAMGFSSVYQRLEEVAGAVLSLLKAQPSEYVICMRLFGCTPTSQRWPTPEASGSM